LPIISQAFIWMPVTKAGLCLQSCSVLGLEGYPTVPLLIDGKRATMVACVIFVAGCAFRNLAIKEFQGSLNIEIPFKRLFEKTTFSDSQIPTYFE
jgi:hypothetical protein